MNKVKVWLLFHVYIKVYMPIVWLVNYGLRDYKKFVSIYGQFTFLSRKQISEESLFFKSKTSNVTGQYTAEIASYLQKTKTKFDHVLLDGDSNVIKDNIKTIPSLNRASITTAGLTDGDYDVAWNFENDIPKDLDQKRFDLIISQSNFEHLIDPYKHFKDLAHLLKKDGIFILATHLPGYPYHRWPIDSVRFMPDWFEECAKRNNLTVVKKYCRIEMIVTYIFQKK